MATFDLTAGNDFVHVAGDGQVPPPSFTDLALATDLEDLARMVSGGTIIVQGVTGLSLTEWNACVLI